MRTPCRKCKSFGEVVPTTYRARRCNLHGLTICDDSCGCCWANKDDDRCGGLTSICLPAEEVYIKNEGFNHFIMYYIAEYAGKWFAQGSICNSGYGSYSLPNIFSTPFETREAAVSDVLRRLLATARSSGDDAYAAIIEKAIMETRQLTLF